MCALGVGKVLNSHKRSSLGPGRNGVEWRTGQCTEHPSDHDSLVAEPAHIHLLILYSFYYTVILKKVMHLDGLKIRWTCSFATISHLVWIPGPDVILYVNMSIGKVKFQNWDCW